jgi:26S proteasome regulatory subunit N6
MVGRTLSSPFFPPHAHRTRSELSSDPTIRSHLAALYDTLLQQNLLRIVEPYSVVEIDYVAQQVGQGRQSVETK